MAFRCRACIRQARRLLAALRDSAVRSRRSAVLGAPYARFGDFGASQASGSGRLRPNDNRVSDHRTIIEPQRSPDGGWTQRTRGETTTSMTAEERNVGQARPEATIPECARRISYVPYPIRDSAAARAPGCADRLVEGFFVCRPAPWAHPGNHADQHRTPSAKSAQDSSRPAREVQLCAEHGAICVFSRRIAKPASMPSPARPGLNRMSLGSGQRPRQPSPLRRPRLPTVKAGLWS